MLVTAVLLLSLPSAGQAGSSSLNDSALLHQAQAAAQEGASVRDNPERARDIFRAAAQTYAALEARSYRNPDLCRNEGNAFFLAGDLAQAIFAYRKGLQLAPNDTLLQQNLDFA